MTPQTTETETPTIPNAPSNSSGSAVIWAMTIIVAIYVAALCINPSPANDLFWQLRTGQDILATHHVPRVDTYSWTRAGHPWTVHEWLAFTLFALAYQTLGGFGGIWLLQVLVIVATFLIFFRVALRETGHVPLTAFLLTIAAATTAGPLFQPRPQIFTYLFLTLTVALLLHVRRQPDHQKRLWLLIPLFAIWANLHAGVLVGLAFLGVFALGDALDPERSKTMLPTEAAVTLAAAIAILANPYGYHLYVNFYETLSSTTALNLVREWASPDFHDSFGNAVELVLAAIAFGLIFSRERKTIAEIVILLALSHAALNAGRNVPLLALVGGLLIAKHLQSTLLRFLERLDHEDPISETSLFGTQVPGPVLIFVGASALIFSYVTVVKATASAPERSSNPITQVGLMTIAMHTFPEAACQFIEAEKFPTDAQNFKMYNIYGEGGYLIWRLPQHKVSMDGRADVYFGAPLEDYAKLNGMPYNPKKIFDKYPMDFVVSETFDQQARYFMSSPDWALVYATRTELDHSKLKKDPDTENSLIFVHRTPANQELILRCRRDCPAWQSPDMRRRYGFYAAVH